MSRSRDDRRRRARELAATRRKARKARARRRARRRQLVWFVIDDPHRGPVKTPAELTEIRSFTEHVLGFGPIVVPPHLVTVGVDLAEGGDVSCAVLVKHTESGHVRIEEVVTDPDSPETTPDHD